ncbi:MAG: hypothetical protein AAF552_04210 [Pseudomonadota bacterium]
MSGRLLLFLLFLNSAASTVHAQSVFSDGFEPAPPVSLTLEVTPRSVLMTSAGEELQLTAQVTDLAGQPVNVPLQWRSSRPAVVSVSYDGVLQAESNRGSAQVFVRAEGAIEAMVMVVIAAPAAGAVLVSDNQVIQPPSPVDENAPFGLGFQYVTRLNGIQVPAPGSLIIGTGEQPIGGRVISSSVAPDGTDVTLEVVSLPELFDQLDLNEQIKLSRQMIRPNSRVADQYDFQQFTDGSLRLTRKASAAKGIEIPPLFDTGNDCQGMPSNITDLLSVNVGPSFDFSPDINLDIVHGSAGIERFVIGGVLRAVFEIQPRLQTNFVGKVTCELTVGTVPFPFGGPFSALLNGEMEIGPGFEIGGTVSLVEQVGYDLTVTATSQFEAGIDCETDPSCETLGSLDLDADGAFQFVVPPLGGLTGSAKLQASARGFLFAKIGVGTLLGGLSFNPIGVTGGLRFGVDLESMLSQTNKIDYASGYKLDLVGTAGATSDFGDLLSLLGIGLPPIIFEISNVLAQSPQGTLVITDPNGGTSAGSSNPTVRAGSAGEPGEMATFTINLTSSTFLTDYAVDRIEIFERKPDGSGGFELVPGRPGCDVFMPSEGQTEFTCQTDFDETGTRTFHAFVRSTVFGVPIPLSFELANQTAASIDVVGGSSYRATASAGDHVDPQSAEDTSDSRAQVSVSSNGASASACADSLGLVTEGSTIVPGDSEPHSIADALSQFSGTIRLPTETIAPQTLQLIIRGNLNAFPAFAPGETSTSPLGTSVPGAASASIRISGNNGACDPAVTGACTAVVRVPEIENQDDSLLFGLINGGFANILVGEVPPGPDGLELDVTGMISTIDGGRASMTIEILVNGVSPLPGTVSLNQETLSVAPSCPD